MNGTGFGFPKYPQRPSVPPRAVGQMLMQKSMMQQDAAMMDPAAMAPVQPMMSAEPVDPSLKEALEAARMRASGMNPGQQRSAPLPFATEQVRRLGVSDAEIELLKLSGAMK